MDFLHLRFETRVDKPAVFRFTERLIAEAHTRSGLAGVATCLGEDLRDLRWLAATDRLIASNDIVRDSRFPLRELAAAAPGLRWIHIIGAGIEPLLPLDWLPLGTVLTNTAVSQRRKYARR